MSFTPDLPSAIDSATLRVLSRVNTSIPGIVQSYDQTTQEATVLPAIKREVDTEDGTAIEALPVVPGVPVVFPGAGAYKITWPLAKGDTVLLVCSQASLDQWLQRGGTVDPRDPRKFDLSDAVAIPGLLSFNEASNQVDGSAMVISGPSIKLGSKDASEFAALQSEVLALRNELNTHTHGGVMSGAAFTSGPAGPAGVPPTLTLSTPVGSTKVEVE